MEDVVLKDLKQKIEVDVKPGLVRFFLIHSTCCKGCSQTPTHTQKVYRSFCEAKEVFRELIEKAAQSKPGSKSGAAAMQEALKQFGAVTKSGIECRQKLSHALDAFSAISSWLETSLEEAYTAFFTAGMQHFGQGKELDLRSSGGANLMQPNHRGLSDKGLAAFLEDFLDLQIAHTNLLSSLAELSSGLELPKADTDVLFGPLSSLLAVHSQLFTTLDKICKTVGRVDEKTVAAETLEALRAAAPVLQNCYPRFIQSESAAKALFLRHKTHTFHFSQRLKRFPPTFDFISTRTSALKHIEQYQSLLEPWARKYDGGVDVLRVYSDICARCREAEARSVAVVPLVALKEVFDGFDDILDYYRTLVCSGTARLAAEGAAAAAATSLSPEETYSLFVFSDCWVLASKAQERFRLVARGDIITGLRVMPADTSAADTVGLRLAWKEKAPASASASASEGNATPTPTLGDTALIGAGMTVEQSAVVRFKCEKPLVVPEQVRAMLRAASDQRMRTRVFGIDINFLTTRPVEHAPDQPAAAVPAPAVPAPAVPRFLVEIARAIRENEGANAVGIFRISSGALEMSRLCSAIDAGQYPDITDPILAASLVRLWLRQLPEGLLTAALHDQWLAAAQVLYAPGGGVAVCRELVASLPPSNRLVLAYLLQHIVAPVVANAAVNKMKAHNVAIVLAPSLLRTTRSDERDPFSMAAETGYACSIVEFLIEHTRELFDDCDS